MNRLVTALMDRIECGLLACTDAGDVLHANAAARRELQDSPLFQLVDNRLRCAAASLDAWLNALHEASVRHRSRLLLLGTEPARQMLAVTPLPVDGMESSVILVMMGRRQVCSPLGLEMLASNHGLTFAESRVFRALVGNRTPREIAASHGVAVATVRTQIQSMREKLGVRSIDALLLRAAEVPPMTTRA
jgi:DNA-binding CsgD family transcriptional regulator